MSYSRSVIVKKAQSFIGLKESDGSHKKIVDIYNSHKPLARNAKMKTSYAWCAATVSAVSISCGYTAIIPTEMSCGYMIELFKKLGEWQEKDSYKPSPGDIIFYDWDDSGKGDCTGWPDHVGIVEKVSGKVITVIEGNKNDAVGRRTINVNGKFIRGYGVPKYDSSGTPTTSNSSTSSSGKNDLGDIAVDGQWGEATTSKAQAVFGTEIDGVVSNQLIAYKAKNPGIVSSFEWQSKKSGYSPLIKAIQKWCGATQDGLFGTDTAKKMQKKLGCEVDGYFSNPSPCIKAFQKWLNKQ